MVRQLSIVAAIVAAAVVPAASFSAEQPAARLGDATHVQGRTIAIGDPTVLICGKPAARVGDDAVGGVVTTPDPLGAGSISVPAAPGAILIGAPTVLIGGKPAARVGDPVALTSSGGVLPPPDSIIAPGCPTVLIGT